MVELTTQQRGDRAMFGVVFLMLFAFSYSEQLVSGLFPDASGSQIVWRAAVIVVDVAVLGVVGYLKRQIGCADGDPTRLWRWWWTGVVFILAIDVFRLFAVQSIRVDVVVATIYALAMGMTMAASLNADPLTMVRTTRRVALPTDWVRVRAIVPLVLGAWVCYLAASAFVGYFDAGAVREIDPEIAEEVAALSTSEQLTVLSQLCEGAINPAFFNQNVAVLPLLLLTLGIEFNYFRRTLTDAGQRAATAATVTVMVAGLVAALSTVPWDGQGCDDVLPSWHEYIAFLLAVQGVSTGLATLVWLLVASTPDASPTQDVTHPSIRT